MHRDRKKKETQYERCVSTNQPTSLPTCQECVCVCVRERERERRETLSQGPNPNRSHEEENVYVLKQLPRSIKVVSAKYRKGDLKMCVFAQSQKSKLKWFFCCCCGTNTPTLICFECIKRGKMANIELDYLIFN